MTLRDLERRDVRGQNVLGIVIITPQKFLGPLTFAQTV